MHICICDVQLDLPLSEVFYKWMLGQEQTLQTDSLTNICPVLARSFGQLYDVARQRRRIEADKSHVWSIMCSKLMGDIVRNKDGVISVPVQLLRGYCVCCL